MSRETAGKADASGTRNTWVASRLSPPITVVSLLVATLRIDCWVGATRKSR